MGRKWREGGRSNSILNQKRMRQEEEATNAGFKTKQILTTRKRTISTTASPSTHTQTTLREPEAFVHFPSPLAMQIPYGPLLWRLEEGLGLGGGNKWEVDLLLNGLWIGLLGVEIAMVVGVLVSKIARRFSARPGEKQLQQVLYIDYYYMGDTRGREMIPGRIAYQDQ